MAPIEVPMTQSGSDADLLQCLIHTGLIGAERAAALQHKNDLAKLFAIDGHSALGGRERFRLNGGVHDRHSQRIVRFRRGQSVKRASTTPIPISYRLDRAPL